jgi:hypothetical protein
MSETSDDGDRAWDEDPKDEPAATSGDSEVHRVDTVPPPASGDAYSADTVIRDVPREALEAIREKRKTSEKRRAAEKKETPAEEQSVVSEETAVEAAEKPAEKKEDAKAPPAAAATKSAEKNAAKAIEKKATAPAVHAPAQQKVIEPPVTLGELTIAFAAAVALIVVGFYVIGSAF